MSSKELANWVESTQADSGWNRAAWEGAEEFTPMRNKLLKNKLVSPGMVCMSDGNVYIFMTSINTWAVACSKQAVTFVNNLVGMENASVKYGDAFEPYVNFIEREASNRIADDMPQSICIGTERLCVKVIPGGLEFEQSQPLLRLPSEKKLLSRLCYMPIFIDQWFKQWIRTPDFPMYRFIAPLFVDPVELKTMEWAIGNALIDPHTFSKTVILHGPGGHGKSTILNTLNSALLGCCGTISDSDLVSLRSGLTLNVASIVASNRVVTAGDVGGENRVTNLSIIKTLTGHDFIPIPPTRVKVGCTLFYASNKLDDPFESSEWLTPAIMRRVVVILINAKIIEDFSGKIPYDKISRFDFAMRCVHTRMTNPYMPVSPLSMLLTLMASKFESMARYLAPVRDGEVDDEDVIQANITVAAALGLTVEELGELARRVSTAGVVNIDGVYYIKNIAPVSL